MPSADRDARFPEIREVVASFPTAAAFRDGAARLLAAGFARTDLSVLASHESLEVAGNVPGYPGTPQESAAAGITDEAGYLMPLAIAGATLVSGGPVAMALAALAGLGIGTVALTELTDRLVANQHSGAFADAVRHGGVLLWARAETLEREALAQRLMTEAGGRDAHVHIRRETL
jgi:hypothetical protein